MLSLGPFMKLSDFKFGDLAMRAQPYGRAEFWFEYDLQNSGWFYNWHLRSYSQNPRVVIVEPDSMSNEQEVGRVLRTVPIPNRELAPNFVIFFSWPIIYGAHGNRNLGNDFLQSLTFNFPERFPPVLSRSGATRTWTARYVGYLRATDVYFDYAFYYLPGNPQDLQIWQPSETPLFPIFKENADLIGEQLEIYDRDTGTVIWTSERAPEIDLDRTRAGLVQGQPLPVYGFVDSREFSQLIDTWQP